MRFWRVARFFVGRLCPCRLATSLLTTAPPQDSPHAGLPNWLPTMSRESKHIAICVCTYKRPLLLKRLLDDLAKQETNDQFDYSIVVADNDSQRSAEPVVSAFAATKAISIRYCVE